MNTKFIFLCVNNPITPRGGIKRNSIIRILTLYKTHPFSNWNLNFHIDIEWYYQRNVCFLCKLNTCLSKLAFFVLFSFLWPEAESNIFYSIKQSVSVIHSFFFFLVSIYFHFILFHYTGHKKMFIKTCVIWYFKFFLSTPNGCAVNVSQWWRKDSLFLCHSVW